MDSTTENLVTTSLTESSILQDGNRTSAESDSFGMVDYSVFGIMLSISLGIGIYFGFFGQSSKTTEEYLLGGRKMKTIPIAISLIASQLSGIAIMAVPAEIYMYGTQYALVVPLMAVVVLMINYIFLPVFYHNHIANCYEVMYSCFAEKVVCYGDSHCFAVPRDEIQFNDKEPDNISVCSGDPLLSASHALHSGIGLRPR